MKAKIKALILDGWLKESSMQNFVTEAASDWLERNCYDVEKVILRDLKIAPCKGCFECWIKTPGICSIDDVGRGITESVIKSNMTVFVTPVTFGGYSSELKKVRDRMIPLISPSLVKIHGERRHRPRYSSFPDIAGIGVLPEKDEESERIFNMLIRRNALQHPGIKYSGLVVEADKGERGIETKINKLFLEMKEPAYE